MHTGGIVYWLLWLQTVTMVTTTRGVLSDIAAFQVYVRRAALRANNRRL